MAYEAPRLLSVSGRTIKIAHLDLPSQPLTYLLEASASSAVSLTVIDNIGFEQNNLILIGELGSETTEIKKINADDTDGTTLTTTAATFAHSAGSPVRKVLFNQWKIYGTSTATFGTNNLVATVDTQVNAPCTTYVNTSTEYTYYWVVAYDSFNSVTGNNSDGVAKDTGYALNSVGSLISSSLEDTKKKKGGVITDEWFLRQINECLTFVAGKLKHWSWLQNFDYSLGSTLRGTFSFTMPTDIDDKNTIKSILGVRVGTDPNLTVKDKREWESLLNGVARTQVRTEGAVGAVTLEVDNSYDFGDSSSVDVFVSGTKYTLTYTGVTRSTTAGVLTGVPASGTGSITVTIPVDTNVWQNESESQPLYFTVFDGSLMIWPLPDASYDYKNVTMDYYTSRTLVNSAGDTIEPPRYDMVKHWLNWKLRALDKSAGELDFNDGDWVMFDVILKEMIRREISGQKWAMNRKVNRIVI